MLSILRQKFLSYRLLLLGFTQPTSLFDIAQDALISKEAVDTVIEISENMHNYPEVYKVFEEYQDELMKNYNLGKISSEAFLNQFKNRTFLYNVSNLTNQKAKQFAREWTRKENTAKNKQKAQQVTKIQQEGTKTSQYEKTSDALSVQNARYSNGQIMNIVEFAKMQNNGKITTQGVINAICHTRPEILEDDIKSFDADKKFLMGND